MAAIRVARPLDAPAVLRLWIQMMEHHSGLDRRFKMGARAVDEQRQAIARLLQGPDSDIFVAETEGKIIGFLTVQIGAATPVYSFARYGWIGDVGVAPEQQGIGIGSQLAAAALAWFREKQITIVQLNAAACNPKARDFWAKVGFRTYLERLWLDFEEKGEGP